MPMPQQQTEQLADSALRDFDVVMTEQVVRGLRARKGFWVSAAVFTAVGAALGAVVPLPAAVAVSAVLVPLTLAKSLRRDPARRLRIDWSTAEVATKEVTAGLKPEARAVLREARQTVAGNLGAPETHLLRMPMGPDLHDGPCGRCPCETASLGGVLWPSPSHPVLIAGERLLAEPGLLRMVIGHEVQHSRCSLRWVRAVRFTGMTAGLFALGLTVPPLWLPLAAAALMAAVIAGAWWEEITCDLAPARRRLDDAAAWYAAAHAMTRARPGWWLAWLLGPTHPPVRLRAAIVTRLARSRTTPPISMKDSR